MINQPGAPGSPGGGPAPTAVAPVPVRLRLVTAAGPGDWLPGALRLGPGSLVWAPDSGAGADPVELATATALPGTDLPGQGGRGRSRKQAAVVDVQTPAGQFQLDMDPVLFGMTQELVAEAAARRGGPAAEPGFG